MSSSCTGMRVRVCVLCSARSRSSGACAFRARAPCTTGSRPGARGAPATRRVRCCSCSSGARTRASSSSSSALSCSASLSSRLPTPPPTRPPRSGLLSRLRSPHTDSSTHSRCTNTTTREHFVFHLVNRKGHGS